MAKMYYSQEEAAAKLNVSIEGLTDLARQGKLQQYRDGTKIVYKAEQVDGLVGEAALDDTGEIELAPADTGAGDAVSLSEAEAPPTEPAKEDTVITAEGISIFDDEDLEIEAADPMAKTQIAPSLEDQISLEGVGSGSGLLDLTRESDDTSLGAEVLEHIDMDSGVGAALEAEAAPEPYAAAETPAVEAPVVVEAIDASAGLFSGFIIGSAVVALVLASVMIATITGQSFSFIESLKDQMGLVAAGAALLVVACGVVGLLLGKSAAARQAAMRRTGG